MKPSSTPQSILVGAIYEHYKKKCYKVLAIARHTESEEELVIYQEVEGNAIWARPLPLFLENVILESVVTPRFKLISHLEDL